MESTQFKKPSSHFFQINIPINLKTIDKLQCLIYLKDQKCAILYQTFILIVNLNLERKAPNKVIKLKGKTPYHITPIGGGFYYTVSYSKHDSCYILIDEKGKTTSIKKAGGTFSSNEAINFYYLGIAFNKSRCWTSTAFSKFDSSQESFPLVGQQQNYMTQKANDEGLIYVNYKQGFRTILNLMTKKIYKIKIPYTYPGQKVYKLILIDDQTGVYASCNENEKMKQVVIGYLTLSHSGSFRPICSFPHYELIDFQTMNPKLKIIMFRLSQYGNTQLLQQPTKFVIFNYEKGQVVAELDDHQSRFSMQTISPDFNHFLKGVQKINGVDCIVDYRFMDIKKLVMHLFKKSELERRFGSEMIRQVLKVIA